MLVSSAGGGITLKVAIWAALMATAMACIAMAETVEVKYRSSVDLSHFECTDTVSSFVNRVCYDKQNVYMLILLKTTWYHYCDIDPSTVSNLLSAESKGRFYNAAIKDGATGGKFSCRDKTPPSYQ
jgi:hypothetical protein